MKNFVAIAICILLTSCTSLPESNKSTPESNKAPTLGGLPGDISEPDDDPELRDNRKKSASRGQEINYKETIKFISAKSNSHLNTTNRVPLNGLYTKITLKSTLDSTSCKGNIDCKEKGTINYHSRNGFLRFFSSKRVAISANANVDVRAYSATIPLLTITEISSSEVGESWERTKIYSKGDEPLFLIPPNVTSGSLKLVFRGSEDKSLSSSKALDVAIGAIGILAPQSQLLTSLNKKAIGDKANALDTAISKSFKESLAETIQVELVLDSWHPNDIYELVMKLPPEKTNWNATATELYNVGKWELKFEAPRVSAFYPVFVCLDNALKVGCKNTYKAAKEEIFKQFKEKRDFFRVLDASLYQINDSEKITIGSIMSKLTSVNQLDDTKYLDGTKYDAVLNSDINLACADIARKSSELGLSSVDTSLAIYSIFMASSIVKVPPTYWSDNLSEFSACELAVSELVTAVTTEN